MHHIQEKASGFGTGRLTWGSPDCWAGYPLAHSERGGPVLRPATYRVFKRLPGLCASHSGKSVGSQDRQTDMGSNRSLDEIFLCASHSGKSIGSCDKQNYREFSTLLGGSLCVSHSGKRVESWDRQTYMGFTRSPDGRPLC